MENILLLILKEALDSLVARMNSPIAGAKLRAEVKRLAEDKGEKFPPAGMVKWSAFLSAYPDDITVIPNPGSDVLVVPVNRPDLLAKAEATVAARPTATSNQTRLRSDIFEALTRIPDEKRAFYLPESDAVLWLSDQEPAPANAVPFPSATFEGEIDLRRNFIEHTDRIQPAKDALRMALESDGPLRQFTHAIRSFGLIQEWHHFRMSALSERLRNWATAHALAFKDGWLGSDELRPSIAPGAALAGAENKRGLVELASLLTDDDISRISIPLDIVLRLLAPR